jgi:hypothetical protein
MKTAKKSVVSLLLCLLLSLSLLPAGAFAADTVAVNSTNFPDPSFRSYVTSNIDKNGDGKLTAAERTAVTSINVRGWYVTNMKGLEHFTALTSLDCGGNQLKKLNLSLNTALLRVNCSGSQLTSLNVTKCSQLQYLACENNKLTTLNVANNPMLCELTCYGNNITSLNIKNNPRLNYAVKKGEKSVTDHITYRITQSTGSFSVVFSIGFDQITSVQAAAAKPPAITAQPRDTTAGENKSVTFTVSAGGSGLTYQWYVIKKSGDPVKLSGKTADRLIFTATRAKNGWKYFCVVSNSGGVVYSRTAALKVIAAPTITSQPKSTGGKAGTKLTFAVKAKGQNLKYQWYYQKPGTTAWVKVSSGTGPYLTLTAKAAKNGWKYRCMVSNQGGQVYTRAVKLTVI